LDLSHLESSLAAQIFHLYLIFKEQRYQKKRNGGHDRDRTCDPLRARQMLSQLSYTPKNLYIATRIRAS